MSNLAVIYSLSLSRLLSLHVPLLHPSAREDEERKGERERRDRRGERGYMGEERGEER